MGFWVGQHDQFSLLSFVLVNLHISNKGPSYTQCTYAFGLIDNIVPFLEMLISFLLGVLVSKAIFAFSRTSTYFLLLLSFSKKLSFSLRKANIGFLYHRSKKWTKNGAARKDKKKETQRFSVPMSLMPFTLDLVVLF